MASMVKNRTISGRPMRKTAFSIFMQHPVFGVGIHGFAYINYMKGGLNVFCHDSILEILSCYGLIGFFLFYRVYILFFRGIKSIIANIKIRKISIFFLCYIIITIVMEPFTINFISQAPVVLLSIAAQYSIELRKKENKCLKD